MVLWQVSSEIRGLCSRKYGKFLSILLEHFIVRKPLISEEWLAYFVEQDYQSAPNLKMDQIPSPHLNLDQKHRFQHLWHDDEILLDCDDCYFWNWIWVLVDIQMYFLNYNPRSFSIYILDYFLLFLDYLRGELNLFFVSLKIGNGKIKGKIVVRIQFSLETYILSVLSHQKLEHFHK